MSRDVINNNFEGKHTKGMTEIFRFIRLNFEAVRTTTLTTTTTNRST